MAASMVPPVSGGYCVKSVNGKHASDRHGYSFDTLVDGRKCSATSWNGISCNQPTKSWVGKTVLEIRAPKDITKINIQYARPQYAPGWKI